MRRILIGLLFLYATHSILCGNNDSASEEMLESQLIQSFLNEAYHGNWYMLHNKIHPYEGFKLEGGKIFLENENEPYSGWYAQFDENQEPRMLYSYEDGQRHGFIYMWDANGTRRLQGEYFKNKRHGEFKEWNKFGKLIELKHYRFNKLHGDSTYWYDSGVVRLESYFLYGHIIDAQGWYPDGKPCPHSRVLNGKGLILKYEEDFVRKDPLFESEFEERLNQFDNWRDKPMFTPLKTDR